MTTKPFANLLVYTALAYALLATGFTTAEDVIPLQQKPHSAHTTTQQPRQTQLARGNKNADDDPKPLKLCDCEPANGDPGGLSCDREGFFITSFERQGQWVAGGGSVPLSRAICCRPCLPDHLTPPESILLASVSSSSNTTSSSSSDIYQSQSISTILKALLQRKMLPMTSNANSRNSKDDPSPTAPEALAVVSFGCHASTSDIPGRCEPESSSFVSGFTDALRIFTRVDTYYPVNHAQCCTPALLITNGDAWELERCECQDSTDSEYPINCNGQDTDLLLQGYDSYRISPLGQVVPIAPARCCKVCLSSSYHPASGCADLNNCNGNGVCTLGRCECLHGWGGGDCSESTNGGQIFHGPVPPWAIVLIVISSCLLASILLLAGFNTLAWIQDHDEDSDEDDEGSTREPLLLRIDADDTGSVGSDDTDYGEDEEVEEEVEQRIENAIHNLQGDDDGAAGTIEVPAAAEPSMSEEQQQRQEESAIEAAEVESEEDESPRSPTNTAELSDDDGDGGGVEEERAHVEPHASDAAGQEPTNEQIISEQQTQEEQQHAGGGDNTVDTSTAAVAEGITEKDASLAARLEAFNGLGPLSTVDCSVCMIRPVQTVVVPCGHVCMCRRCSRRLQKCPICRKDIARRQRLFI